jgi:DNA-binding LytR/AlgR family response regulator
MIRVFLYHSQITRLQFLQKAIVSYFQKHKHTYRLTACARYEEAAAYLRGDGRQDDVFFLQFTDFAAGIRLAACLREQNPGGLWIFMDGPPENLYQSMLLQPSGYLPDSADGRTVLVTLRRVERYLQMLQKKYYFSFKCEGEYLRIPYDDIAYFESSAKKVMLQPVTDRKRYCFIAKLDDLAVELPSSFLRCHQSYLVNMNVIRSLDTQHHVFLLQSNEEILISRRSYREAKETYQQFLERHG